MRKTRLLSSLASVLTLTLILLASAIASPAVAQGMANNGELYTYCQSGERNGGSPVIYAATGIFLYKALSYPEREEIENQFKGFVESKSSNASTSYLVCSQQKSKDDANYYYNSRIGGRRRVISIYADWAPKPAIPIGAVQSIALLYKGGELARHGYRSASIKLNYRFLLCADEIQVAYGLDRKSQEHSEQYVAHPSGSGNFEYATPASEPPLPLALPINLSIVRKATGAHVAKLVDANAGESLGSGCVTGQTRKIGTAAALVGANPTRAQIQDYLNSLTLRGQDTDGGATLDLPLTNPDIPVPASARTAPKPATHAPARRAAPRKH